MSKYLFIESRDPFVSNNTKNNYELIQSLSKNGHEVVLFLVQNGVFPSRKISAENGLENLLETKNISVLADDCSLFERGISSKEIHSQISISSMDALIDIVMEDDCKPIWN